MPETYLRVSTITSAAIDAPMPPPTPPANLPTTKPIVAPGATPAPPKRAPMELPKICREKRNLMRAFFYSMKLAKCRELVKLIFLEFQNCLFYRGAK